MAGRVVTNVVQLGDSATASQNLVIRTNVDGTFTIARGNFGATTQDILTINANGRVLMPPTYGPAFSAYRAKASAIFPTAAWSETEFDGVGYNPGNCYNPANYRFTPNVPGLYLIGGSVYLTNSSPATLGLSLYKSGIQISHLQFLPTGAGGGLVTGSYPILMNGTTDYVNLFGYSNIAGTTINAGASLSAFWGYMVREA